MKVLSTEQQNDLRSMIEQIITEGDATCLAQLNYWAIELKPKRVRKKTGGLNLNTEEGVIEQAYQEHTGNV